MAEDLSKLLQQPDISEQNNSLNQDTRNYCLQILANILIL